MEDWVVIRNLKIKNPKLGTRKIAELAGVSRNTVKKALESDNPPEYKQREEKTNPDLAPFKEYIKERLEKKRLKGSKVLEEIKSKGYKGSRRAFYRFAAKVRVKEVKTFQRYETQPGEQGQFDWSPYTVRLGEQLTRITVFCYLLGYSRYRIYEASLSETQGSVLEALESGIRKTQGVPLRIQTDNAKCFVINASKENFKWNPRYLNFCGHYKFTPSRSIPGHPWSKGKVENQFDYLEDHFIAGGEFKDFEDFHRQLKIFEQEVNQRVHQTTNRPPKELFELEKTDLNTLPAKCYIGIKEEVRTVTYDCLICFKSNRYSVPHIFAGKEVWLRVSRGYLLEIYSSTEILIAVHRISLVKGEIIIDRSHYKNHSAERGNWDRLANEFREKFPGHQWFMDKLKVQKRINPGYHLTQIIALSKFYEDIDIQKAFEETARYNMYSHTLVKAYLEKNAKPCAQKVSVPSSKNITESEQDIKRPLDQYKLFN